MKIEPFQSPQEEAEAIRKMLDGDLTKTLGTCDLTRISEVRSDGLKRVAELNLLTNSQNCSHAP